MSECHVGVVAGGALWTMTSSSAPQKDLLEFLQEAELEHYHAAIVTQLRVTAVSQFKYVVDDDLQELGMTRPEIRRFRKFYKKECPQGTFGKLRKVIQGAGKWHYVEKW